MIRGWALIGTAMGNSEWLQFSGIRMKGKSYIELESDALVKQALDSFKARGI